MFPTGTFASTGHYLAAFLRRVVFVGARRRLAAASISSSSNLGRVQVANDMHLRPLWAVIFLLAISSLAFDQIADHGQLRAEAWSDATELGRSFGSEIDGLVKIAQFP